MNVCGLWIGLDEFESDEIDEFEFEVEAAGVDDGVLEDPSPAVIDLGFQLRLGESS